MSSSHLHDDRVPLITPPIISISALQRIILALYQHQQAIALNDFLLSRPGCCCAQFPTPATEFPAQGSLQEQGQGVRSSWKWAQQQLLEAS